MKKITFMFVAFMLMIGLHATMFAQQTEKTEKAPAYSFTPVKENAYTPVKNQFRSGTCWSFSTVSFLESELLRTKNKTYNLADMFPVYHAYEDKADKYARYHGQCSFPTGGANIDVIYVLKNYGMAPEEAYTGLIYDEKKHDHAQLDNALGGYIKSVINDKTKKLNPSWKVGFTAILNAYLGVPPTDFTFEGKKYTPKSFANELGLNADNYVKISSFQYRPYYQKSVIEVPDNWLNGEAYNVPLKDFRQIIDYAIEQGYTIAWGGDVSEPGFSWKNGVAIVPDEDNLDLTGTDRDRLAGLSEKDRKSEAYKFEKPVKEKVITEEMRQKAYDDYSTTDDHGMHIVGTYKDQNGVMYYKTKNSWDVDNPYGGFIYMSSAYIDYKSLDIMVHKDALSKEMKQKLGIK